MTRFSILLLGLLPLLLSCGDGGPSGPSAQPVVIATSSFPEAAVGIPYSAILAATGGTGSHAWSLESGALPAGLSLSVGGAIMGTPTTAGISPFTVRATSGNESATRGFAISVLPPGVVIGTASLPDGMVGIPYNQSLTASGGTGVHSWSLASGTLPAGLAISGLGTISGTPTAAGTSTFTVQAASGGQTATRALTITIGMPPLSVTSAALADGIVGVAYTETLAAVGGSGSYSWSLAGGALPAGLSLSAAGILSGLPAAAGASSFTVRVTSGSQQATRGLTITVASPSIRIATLSLPDGVLGQGYSQTLRAEGGTGTYEWSLAGGTLPAGLTLTAAGVISGTPAAPGVSTFTVRATSGGQAAALVLTITVQLPPVSVTTSTLPDGTLGVAYTQQLGATGGTGVYTWSLAVGSLPPGLTLSASGLLAGTPTSLGTTTFTVRVSSGSASATRELVVNVAAPPVVITTSTLPAGTVGQPYSQALVASGGTGAFTWTLAAGTLPPGLALSAAGILAGTPTTVGTSTFTVRASSGGREATKQLTLTVGSAVPPLTITTTALPAGNVGAPYAQALLATGGTGTYGWSLAVGSQPLPAGLTLSAAGLISGTPSAQGTFTFTVRAASGEQSTTADLSLTVGAALPNLVITTTSLAGGTVGSAYSQQLTATGGTGTYLWRVSTGTLPPGLSLSTAGLLSGMPSTAGSSTFTVEAASSTLIATKELTLTVGWPLVNITTTTLPAGAVGTPYSQTLVATGGDNTYGWSLATGSGPLPAGLNISAAGLIGGTPTTQGTSNFTVRVTSAGGTMTDTQALSITVGAVLPSISITTAALPNGVRGQAYSQQLAATGGSPPYTWTSTGALPAGLSLAATTGIISGTPAAAGTSSFQVRATDGTSTGVKDLSITITNPPVSIATTTVPNAIAGVPYSTTLTATGGDGSSYTWTVTAGSLPVGLALSGGGVLSGTAQAAGASTITVQVASGGQTASRSLTLTVENPLVIGTGTPLPAGTAGTAYSVQLAATGGNGSTYSWSRTTGTLPAGLSLSAAGLLSGTPTAAGTANFTVQVASGSQTVSKDFALTITLLNSLPPTVTTTTLPDGTRGVAYSQQLAATNGDGSFQWALAPASNPLPSNLVLSATGLLSGTPQATGSSTFTVQVTSAGMTDDQVLTLTVVNPPVVITTTSPLPQATRGSAYSTTLAATGGDGVDYTWSVAAGSSLPGWLSLSATGVLSGNAPNNNSASSFTLQATSGGNTGTKAFTLQVR